MDKIIEIEDTLIEGLKIIKPNVFKDERGIFIKTYNFDFFKEVSLNFQIKETYFTISKRDVIRGMHFQTSPYEHTKIVYVPNGKILDVVLDIRRGSPTYGKYFSCNLSSENRHILIIPIGLAHGFKSLKDNTNVTYMQTAIYSPLNDLGIHYESFGFDWACDNPIVSSRDLSFQNLEDLNSSFIYKN